ncbi:MAG: riboflavin synthase subunit alpha [Candidatus Magasanikbacteria bacterium RIFOXYD2_FULL_36_9]|uniref:Riboflavin synthase n=1 Tax=Candidatus Magasanikbacteria bacterium RIFOXYD2_FULL_36_9 TaxID=1798707 RepID=A0A1F6NYF4_9BACT|nr:MAG: riboflavin synthase subunit alpha [Candidatus Magasanikbacteria bacterium RIFOXYD2_FULL_36_9]
MFTGIVENLGILQKNKGSSFVFSASQIFCNKIKKGTSVAINGVCLTTVNKPTKTSFLVDVMPETKNKTMFGKLKVKDVVNLELPATLNTFLSGHLVQGHIDGVGMLKSIEVVGNSRLLKVQTKNDILSYIVKKGSVTLNGISLTVVSVGKNFFTVAIIPFTWKNTMLCNIKVGDCLNIETDILGKYLKKFLNK